MGQHDPGGGAKLPLELQQFRRHPQPDSGSIRVSAIRARRNRLVLIGRSVCYMAVRARGIKGRGSSPASRIRPPQRRRRYLADIFGIQM